MATAPRIAKPIAANDETAPEAESLSFESRIAQALPRLSPAEQRVARFFLTQKESLLLGSAVEIAAAAGASDATVVRTARSLGFDGLADLREAVLGELTSATPSPSNRLRRTLHEAGADAAAALHHVLGTHEESLRVLREPQFARSFTGAVDILAETPRCHVFGIGPSGAMADYATLQFNRIGLPATALSVSGIGLADRLIGLRSGEALLMIAYAPIYREVAVALDRAEQLKMPVILISDSLGPFIGKRARHVLPVPRGRAVNLSMHGATLVTIEALATALAARRRVDALASLEELGALRGALDKDWLKRGLGRNGTRRG
ncbi:MAG TPA: MurR/RpiR family transcriptional regulator [Terriglobia bacterium]|nr:MurR/RpiR family transcriptional regulator [Terriglobia bacterium]